MAGRREFKKGDLVEPSYSGFSVRRGLKRGRSYLVTGVKAATFSRFYTLTLEGVVGEISSKHVQLVGAREKRLAEKAKGFKTGDKVKPIRQGYARLRGINPEGPLTVTATNGVETRAGQYIKVDKGEAYHTASAFEFY